jgi:hypothetical protein
MTGHLSVRNAYLTSDSRFKSFVSPGEDIYFQPDTARIATSLIEDLLDRASGKDEDGKPFLTYSDLSKVLSQRIADSESTNPQFSYTFIIRILAWGK